MSWLERISKDLEVFTGDGKTYRPSWLNAKKSTSWNVTTYEFPNLEGTFVDRRLAKGDTFDLELYFVGDDNIDRSDEFQESAKDRRHWHLRHPYYGDVRVQPFKIAYDNSAHNVTKITCTVQETILGVFPKGVANPTSELQQRNEAVNLASVESVNTGVSRYEPSDSLYLKEQVELLSASTLDVIEDDDEAAEYQNLVATAISNTVNDIDLAISSIVAVANYPAKLSLSAKRRLDLVAFQFVALNERIDNADQILSYNERLFYETIQGTLITTGFLSAGTPIDENDYEVRSQVNDAILELVGLWNAYVERVDGNKLQDPASTEQYVPDSNAMFERETMLNQTIGALYDISEDTRQEFEIILEEDSNIILLTHRFYGLDDEDENLALFDRTNNLGLNESIVIKKGRRIVYYI